jgi:hypothetical protein
MKPIDLQLTFKTLTANAGGRSSSTTEKIVKTTNSNRNGTAKQFASHKFVKKQCKRYRIHYVHSGGY